MELKINLKEFVPKNTYSRKGAKCYLDPFRQMLVPLTRESLLLYKMEMYVNQVMGVPKNMMYINQSFRKYGMDSSKIIDIVIHDMIEGEMKPVAIIECKSPGLALYHTTTSHIEDFAKKMGVNYLIVTNGNDVDSYISRADRLSFWKIDNIPDYETICNGHREVLATEFAAHTGTTKAKKPVKKADQTVKFNSKTTPKEIQPVIMSLVKCFRDDHCRAKTQAFEQVAVVGDYGLRRKLSGFGSEKVSNSLLRTLLIRDFYNNHQLVSLNISPDSLGAPVLSVTLDDYDNRQVILNIDLVHCLKQHDERVTFSYSLTHGFANESDIFLQGLIQFVTDKAPQLLKHHDIAFGELHFIEPLKMDQDEVAQLCMNVIAFALLLDEYREHIKSGQKASKKSLKK